MSQTTNRDPSAGTSFVPHATDLALIRAVADSLPLLVWSCLPDGYCDYLSRRWVEYTGVPEAEHHGRGWLRAVHPADRDRTRDGWEAFVAGLADYDVDYRLRRHDGVYRWFKTRGVLIRDAGGTPVRVLGTTTDVDDQRRAEERDREGRERLGAALAASGTGTFRWDIRTNALDWDEELDRLFGLPPGQTVRSLDKFVERVHPDDRAGVVERCRRCKEDGADFAMEFRVVWPDGSVRWLDDRGRTFRDAAGRPAYMTGACVDITDRQRAAERIREADERAAFVRRASGVGFWYCDLPFDVLEWDERVKEHFHLPPDAPVTIDTFYARIHPDDRGPTRRAIERSIADRTGYDVHYRTVDPDTGAEKWVRAIGRTFYAPDGTPRRFDGVTLDVTTEKRAEGRQRFLAVLAAATEPAADPDELTALSARLLAEHLGCDRCAYAEVVDEAAYVITGDHARGVPSIVGRWELAAFGAEHHRLMRAGEPYVVHDADADPRVAPEDQAAYRATAIRAVVCVPLLKAGRFTAAMAVRQATPRRWTDDEVDLVRTVAGRCWEALERARAARRLRESEERFRAFMDNSPAAAWVTDADGRVRYLSATYARMFRLPEREFIGAAVADLYPDEFAREYVRNIRAVAESGRPLETVERAPRPDGSVGEFLVYKFPLPGTEWVGGVAVDITARVRAEEALREADRRKDEFIALLAHELRNPLAPLRNGLQVLRLAGTAGDAAEKARGMMERQLGHMVRLVDDLLDVSRISRNKLHLRRERVLLADAVAAAVEAVRPAVDAARHALAVDLPAGPVVLDADLTRLAQVFSNLLANAAKFTPPGGRIRLSAEVRGGEVEVAVRDTGVGIPSDALGPIFDMFSQVDRSLERATGGLGIGLALVKGLVEMHGGRVRAESPGPSAGSTFTVELPVAREQPPAEAAEAGRAGVAPGGPARRVLVVDDNRDAAESMAAMLQILGHEARTAHDGAAAVDAAEGFRPDLILMDVGMPRLNGYDATRRIRERPWGRSVTVVALTGWGQEGDRAQSRAAGCDGHLVKPVHLDDLAPFLDYPAGR